MKEISKPMRIVFGVSALIGGGMLILVSFSLLSGKVTAGTA